MAAGSDLDALRAVVMVEHAAIFGIAAAGGRLDALTPHSPGTIVISHAFDVHRLRRDELVAAIRALSGSAPASAAAYLLPALPDAAAALALAASLEETSAHAYRQALKGLRTTRWRVLASQAVIDSARSQAQLLLIAGRPASIATSALPGS